MVIIWNVYKLVLEMIIIILMISELWIIIEIKNMIGKYVQVIEMGKLHDLQRALLRI